MALQDYTKLKGVREVGDSLFMSTLENNLKVFFDWGLLGIGAWFEELTHEGVEVHSAQIWATVNWGFGLGAYLLVTSAFWFGRLAAPVPEGVLPLENLNKSSERRYDGQSPTA